MERILGYNSFNESKLVIDGYNVKYELERKRIIDPNTNLTYTIYYGINAISNDYLTTIYSGKNAVNIEGVEPSSQDIWMHSHGTPGCHLIIKAIVDDKIPEYIIIEASKIAKKNSKSKDLDKSIVGFCYKDYIKKDSNSKIGEVYITPISAKNYVEITKGGCRIVNNPTF